MMHADGRYYQVKGVLWIGEVRNVADSEMHLLLYLLTLCICTLQSAENPVRRMRLLPLPPHRVANTVLI